MPFMASGPSVLPQRGDSKAGSERVVRTLHRRKASESHGAGLLTCQLRFLRILIVPGVSCASRRPQQITKVKFRWEYHQALH